MGHDQHRARVVERLEAEESGRGFVRNRGVTAGREVGGPYGLHPGLGVTLEPIDPGLEA